MFKTMFKAIALSAFFATGYVALQTPGQADGLRATYASVGNSTSVPYGWVDFCARYAGECPDNDLNPMDINLTPAAMKIVERVNHWVNTQIEPVSDMEHWAWSINGTCRSMARAIARTMR